MNAITNVHVVVDLTSARLGPYRLRVLVNESNRMTEKGQTHPTPNGKMAGFLNPVSFEVNMASVALLAHSYPEK